MIISESEKKIALGSDRKHPAVAVIKERYALTKPGSTKEVYHITLDLKNAPLSFKAGDSIGIFPQNDPIYVEHLLRAIGAKGSESILDGRSGVSMSVWHFLSYKANLARITSSFIKLLHEEALIQGHSSPLSHLLLAENKPQLTDYLSTHEVLDLLHVYQKVELPLEILCAQFSPLLPRFYSVASSPSLVADEVDLTVALTTYPLRDQQRYGVASHFLCHLAQEKSTPITLYVQSTQNFILPQENHTPIIMIGPGTGVAPFRAFVQERIHRGAQGKNWLFFGDRHRAFNYYYREFWETTSSQGLLNLTLAFSRDQDQKRYVQHSMYENAKELFGWLQEGAHLYVCGDAQRMAKDVEGMLRTILQEQGSMTEETARAYLKALRAQKRYLMDVY